MYAAIVGLLRQMLVVQLSLAVNHLDLVTLCVVQFSNPWINTNHHKGAFFVVCPTPQHWCNVWFCVLLRAVFKERQKGQFPWVQSLLGGQSSFPLSRSGGTTSEILPLEGRDGHEEGGPVLRVWGSLPPLRTQAGGQHLRGMLA